MGFKHKLAPSLAQMGFIGSIQFIIRSVLNLKRRARASETFISRPGYVIRRESSLLNIVYLQGASKNREILKYESKAIDYVKSIIMLDS